jgi:hypothetical protein
MRLTRVSIKDVVMPSKWPSSRKSGALQQSIVVLSSYQSSVRPCDYNEQMRQSRDCLTCYQHVRSLRLPPPTAANGYQMKWTYCAKRAVSR